MRLVWADRKIYRGYLDWQPEISSRARQSCVPCLHDRQRLCLRVYCSLQHWMPMCKLTTRDTLSPLWSLLPGCRLCVIRNQAKRCVTFPAVLGASICIRNMTCMLSPLIQYLFRGAVDYRLLWSITTPQILDRWDTTFVSLWASCTWK